MHAIVKKENDRLEVNKIISQMYEIKEIFMQATSKIIKGHCKAAS